jgi:GrpB-like predicted nucleotidyltransferase (UPF0157 family)
MSAQAPTRVTIADPDPRWPDEFLVIEQRLGDATAGEGVMRIDHIRSTSVPHLPAKDIIDIQITVTDDDSLYGVGAALAARGWRLSQCETRDHHVAWLPADLAEWRKAFLTQPDGERRVHVHVRIHGRANQRYALLFRDFLRTHPDAAQGYLLVKLGLAVLAPDIGSYADAKDPTCDLIYRAAETWAKDENGRSG